MWALRTSLSFPDVRRLAELLVEVAQKPIP
jgi:hypothetical protein